MAESIVLNVRVNGDKASSDVKKFGSTVKTEMQSVQTTTTTSLNEVNRSTRSMGERFAGAGAAISTANASLQLMGRQGPPALQTLAAGAASVAVSGFGPLSIAVVGVTTALSFLLSQSSEVDEALGKIDDALRSTKGETKSLSEEIKRLDIQLKGLRQGTERTPGEVTVFELEGRLRELNRQQLLDSTVGDDDYQERAKLITETLRQIDKLEQRESRLAEKRGIEAQRANEAADAERRLADERRRAAIPVPAPDLGGAGPSTGGGTSTGFRSSGNNAFLAESFRLDMDRQRIIDEEAQRLGRQVDAQRRADAERDALANRLRLEREGVTMSSLLGVDGEPGTTTSAISADSQARAASITRSMASSFTAALAGEDFSTVGRSIAQSVATALTDAAISGALEGFGVKKAFASGFESIGGAFLGSGS